MILLCLAIALHDVDGPIRCQSGEKIRLEGIGATEMDGTCRPDGDLPFGTPARLSDFELDFPPQMSK